MIDQLLWLASRWALVLLEPIGLLWLALTALAIGLWWKRHPRLAATIGGMSLAILGIGGTELPNALIRHLEQPFHSTRTAELPPCDALILLGGGASPSTTEITGLQFTRAADRIVTAVELVRRGKAPVLCIGGSAVALNGRILSESQLLRDALVQRGAVTAEVIALEICRDTHDEAIHAAKLIRERGWKSVMLVTSAAHMRRAVATFRTAGVEVVPAPCNFIVSPDSVQKWWKVQPPGYWGFEKISIWLHEQIGWIEYRRRGWISTDAASAH